MGIRLLSLLEEELGLYRQLLELAREIREQGEGGRETFNLEVLERLTQYQEQREDLFARIDSIQEVVVREGEEIETASLPQELQEKIRAVSHQVATMIRDLLEVDRTLQQRLIGWQAGLLDELKRLQEGKRVPAAYQPSGELPPRFFDRKI
ncbi:MAG: hypothetical protein HYY20_09430 [Candidatus Tectomicrobia bacterium]|uniref:Flagellar protein FlgN n=1 Tax=Tectimicrobiota bacterium TaxID=2528274 RepID=A0A932CPF7_UNCTE|nr:hypothetical protein [Candidatus Tectomicrobia bacterium]